MDIKREIYKIIENSNITDVSDYSYSSSIDEVSGILETTSIELLIAHFQSRELALLSNLIKGKKTRIIIIGSQGLEAGNNLLCGNCTSSWHEAIPFELNTDY